MASRPVLADCPSCLSFNWAGGLRAALAELLAAESTPMPPYEAGKDAQDAWGDRRAKARNDAAALSPANTKGAQT